jgi:hypothetical protein
LTVRELAGTLRFGRLVYLAEKELVAYLNRSSFLSPLQQAHLILLDWLNESGQKRKHLFLCNSDGTLRGGAGTEPWNWFSERIRMGKPCTKRVLDEWEDETVRREEGKRVPVRREGENGTISIWLFFSGSLRGALTLRNRRGRGVYQGGSI